MAVHVDRSLRLPESEYFAEPQAKSGIALHHTVCDSARTTLDIWRRDKAAGGKPRRVATAFVIDKDGTIFEAFDPAAWAWQFGLSWRAHERIRFEKRFIGIEITSEGGLLERDGRLYAYDRVRGGVTADVGDANGISARRAADSGPECRCCAGRGRTRPLTSSRAPRRAETRGRSRHRSARRACETLDES